MQEREHKGSILDELKIEHKHQIELIRKLRYFDDELNRAGYGPLDRLRHIIAAWEQSASRVKGLIEELERTPRD
jgi:hypothetical protein